MLLEPPMQILKRLVKITHQVGPRPVSRIMACNDDIICAAFGALYQFGVGQRAQASSSAVSANSISGLFGSGQAKAPDVMFGWCGLQYKAS